MKQTITHYSLVVLLPNIILNIVGLYAEKIPASIVQRDTAHTINLFIQRINPYNLEASLDNSHHLLQHPDKLARRIFQTKLSSKDQNGIPALYKGQVAFSDHHGQIIFPQHHTSDEVTVIITKSIRPVILRGRTVEYFTRITNDPEKIAYYTLKQIKDDNTKSRYWHVTKDELPTSKKISLNTIVIFAQPKHIDIIEGIVVTVKSPNLLLPSFFATKDLTKDMNAIELLKISKYFDPVKHLTKHGPQRYGRMILP